MAARSPVWSPTRSKLLPALSLTNCPSPPQRSSGAPLISQMFQFFGPVLLSSSYPPKKTPFSCVGGQHSIYRCVKLGSIRPRLFEIPLHFFVLFIGEKHGISVCRCAFLMRLPLSMEFVIMLPWFGDAEPVLFSFQMKPHSPRPLGSPPHRKTHFRVFYEVSRHTHSIAPPYQKDFSFFFFSFRNPLISLVSSSSFCFFFLSVSFPLQVCPPLKSVLLSLGRSFVPSSRRRPVCLFD